MKQEIETAMRQLYGDCTNTFAEDQKHFVMARLMGLAVRNDAINISNVSILDIGGGPNSMLLKCHHLKNSAVVDPIKWPLWIEDRYASKSIKLIEDKGEYINETGYDEVWITDTLAYANDPQRLINNAISAAPRIRIFEWINEERSDIRPNVITKNIMNQWMGMSGKTVELSQRGCYGTAYFGVFEGWG
jgi:hypothetical protein